MIDKFLTSVEILSLPDVHIDIGGVKLSTHDLARAGWTARVRKRWGRAKSVKVCINNGRSFLSTSAKTQTEDLEYVWSLLERGLLTKKGRVTGLNTFSDAEILSEMRRRNPVTKRKKPVKTNIIRIEEFLQKQQAEGCVREKRRQYETTT